MIYIATVHWRSTRWIAPQRDYLRRNISSPFRVFASLNGIDDPSFFDQFDHAEDITGHHGTKLNALASLVTDQADPEDVLVFLDSDAFPVRPLEAWLPAALAEHEVVAVQRRENCGDARPHPSFCASTVGTWSKIGADWSKVPWTTPTGAVLEDAGTLVLGALEDHGIDWLPLVRTNTVDVHPLWFGVYGHVVYHHGAGSRTKWSPIDQQKVFTEASLRDPSLGSLTTSLRKDPRALLRVRPRHLGVLPAASARSVRQVRKRMLLKSVTRRSDHVFARLVADPGFYRQFDPTA